MTLHAFPQTPGSDRITLAVLRTEITKLRKDLEASERNRSILAVNLIAILFEHHAGSAAVPIRTHDHVSKTTINITTALDAAGQMVTITAVSPETGAPMIDKPLPLTDAGGNAMQLQPGPPDPEPQAQRCEHPECGRILPFHTRDCPDWKL